ncbi:hypothetical protein FS837_004854 [Tulasnella sp. UAMH 9824]|nr:hypothetical protein FS837_004854 [Tulasnella sp. UAMH 9824]
MPKDQLEKAASFASPRNQQNELQAARAQKALSHTQSAPVITDNRWRTERLPFYSYRDVAYAIEGPDQITRTPRRVYLVTEEDTDKVVGFDMEWPYNPKTGVSGKTSMDLIESPNVIKTGFWIANDCGKLMADFTIAPKACVELADIAKTVDRARLENLGLLRYPNSFKFALAVRLYLKKELAKDETISDWSEDLSEEHLEYAANDAYAGLVVFKVLKAFGDERRIDVDLPSLAEQAASDAIKRVDEWKKLSGC